MRTLEFNGKSYPFGWWQGELLRGTVEQPLAFDLETRSIKRVREPLEGETEDEVPLDPLDVPEPALGMAYDGSRLVLIHPKRLAQFVTTHRYQGVVGHNLQFDWHCLYRAVNDGVRKKLWGWGTDGLLHDTMILDLLLQLATGKYRHVGASKGEDQKLFPASLGVLSEEYGVGELDKTDPFRVRYGELIGLSEEEIDAHPEAEGFFGYALKDVLATWGVYPKQREQALNLMRKAGWSPDRRQKTYEIRPDAVERFGVLSESVQVRASITLAELSRKALRIDRTKRAELEHQSRGRYQKALDTLLVTEPDLIKRYPPRSKLAGQIKYTARSGIPQMDVKRLVGVLTGIASGLGVPVPLSDGKLKGVSTSAKAWAKYAERSEFVAAWGALEKEAKLLEFLTTLDADHVYARYGLLKRSGRTSAEAYRFKKKLVVPSLNVQQMPREDPNNPESSLRSVFLAPEGKLWLSSDYGYIEIRALAAVARARFGHSKMAEVVREHTLRGGLDPHQRMACQILGVTPEEFLRLPKADQKTSRQKSKAAGFGFPGGLGIEKFLQYAKTSYGATFTKQEAKDAKAAWFALYPEMKKYLSDHTDDAFRWVTGREKIPRLTWLQRKRLSEFLRSKKVKLTDDERELFWEVLEWLAHYSGDHEAVEDVESRKVTARVRRLTHYRACTLTGRVRNGTTYTQNANTPFQSAAADGAKEALWRLMREGHDVMAFLHDSFEVAIPKAGAKQRQREIERIMVEEMQKVLEQDVPVAVEGVVSERWAKA